MDQVDTTCFSKDEIISADEVIEYINNVTEPNDLLDLNIAEKECRIIIFNLIEQYAAFE